MKKKPVKENITHKVAILVDGDNASSAKLEQLVELAARYGAVAVKRIYGDWTKASLSYWKDPARELSFRLIEAMPYVKGKNTTDIALIIDAMDLLHTKDIDIFLIASSDSDYAPLAGRICEDGITVIGYGESKTPVSFINSCSDFVFSDKEISKKTQQDTPDVLLKKEVGLFNMAFDAASADGKAEITLSQIGMAIKRINPKFKTRRYGCKTLGAIFEKLEDYELIPTDTKGTYNVRKKTTVLSQN
jgi:hypothetical protein